MLKNSRINQSARQTKSHLKGSYQSLTKPVDINLSASQRKHGCFSVGYKWETKVIPDTFKENNMHTFVPFLLQNIKIRVKENRAHFFPPHHLFQVKHLLCINTEGSRCAWCLTGKPRILMWCSYILHCSVFTRRTRRRQKEFSNIQQSGCFSEMLHCRMRHLLVFLK